MNKFIDRNEPGNSLQNLPRDRGLWHVSQAVFWLEFICFMICMTWHYTYHTTVSFLSSAQQRQVLEIVTVVAILNIVFLCGYSRRQLFEIAALLLLLAVSRYNSQYDDGYLLYSMAIALSCRRVQPTELIRRLFYIYLTIFWGVLFLYRMGIFSPLNSGEERYRMNLGFSHYNTLGMVIVCIITLWILLRYEKARWFDFAVWIGAAVFVWEVPNSRTATLCILLLSIGIFFSRYFSFFHFRPIKLVALSAFPVMAFFSFFSSYFYTPENSILFTLDELFSHRLNYGNKYLQKYPIPSFGQKIRRINPDAALKAGIPPEILDNGYLRILLQLGIITFTILIIIFIYIIYKAMRQKHYAIVIGLIVISFYNVSEFYMTSLFANSFLFFFTYYRYGDTTDRDFLKEKSTSRERTQIMKEYSYYGKYIDMKQSLHYLALHWLSILLAVIAAAAIACGLSFKDQYEAQKAYTEKYPDGLKEITLSLNAEENEAIQQYLSDTRFLNNAKLYSEESLYMAIDANNVPHYVLTYTFSCPEVYDATAAANLVKACVNSMQQETKKDGFFDKWAAISGIEEKSSKNLRELMTIGTVNNSQITIEICSPDEETLTLLSHALISLWEEDIFPQIQKSYPQMQMSLDDQYMYTSRDTKIRDTQSGILTQISTYATRCSNDLEKLTDNAKNYLEKYEETEGISIGDPITYTQKVSAAGISKKKAVVSGMKAAVAAVVILILFWLMVYLATNRIWGKRTIERSYRISKLGSFLPDEAAERVLKCTNKTVWRYYIRHVSRDIRDNHELAFTLRSLIGLTGNKKSHHLLVLSDSLYQCEQMKTQLHEFLINQAAETVTILTEKELLDLDGQNSPVDLENVDGVLLAVIMGRSTYSATEHLLSLSSLYNEKMLGYLMIE